MFSVFYDCKIIIGNKKSYYTFLQHKYYYKTPQYTVTAEGKMKIYDSKFPCIVEEGGIYLYQNYRNSLSALLRWENEKEKTGGAQFSNHFRYFDCF